MEIREGLEIDDDALADICRRYHLKGLWLFGSSARGDFRADSDIDLLYEFAPDEHIGWAIVHLKEELEKLFGRDVDLVSRHFIHWYIRDEVLAEAKPLHAA